MKDFGDEVALVGWFLALIDPLMISYSIALLDVAAAMFLTLTVYIASRDSSNLFFKNIQVGVICGLAVLCKYSVLPILLGVGLLQFFILEKSCRVKDLAVIVFSSLIVILAGNPLLWPPSILGYSGFDAMLSSSSKYSVGQGIIFVFDWLELALQSSVFGHQIFYFSIFLAQVSMFPFRLFAESIIVWCFFASLIYRIRARSRMSDSELLIFSWLISATIFFWLIAKSRVESYYAVMLGPPMVILATLMSPLSRRRVEC
ncbi:MAG: hypothetical protein QXQ11_08495 [Candidatus Bathyarchaeia archaeon]